MIPQIAGIYKQTKYNAVEKYYPTTRHTATLTQLYVKPTGAFPQAFTQKPNKRNRKRESRLPFCVVPQHDRFRARASRLSCLAPLEHSLLCLKRDPLVRFSSTDSRAPLSLGASQARLSSLKTPSLSKHFPPHASSLHSFSPSSLTTPPSPHTRKTLFTLRPALFWARSIRARQSGEDTPPSPCLSSLRISKEMSRIPSRGGPSGPPQRGEKEKGRETARTIVIPSSCVGVLAGNRAAAMPHLISFTCNVGVDRG